MKDFRRLLVWEKAHRLTLACYAATARFPREELYGLTSQVRRCSASFAANLAEGCGKDSDGELGRFVQISAGSARELEYHLLLAKDLGFLVTPNYEELDKRVLEVQGMLASLVRRLGGSPGKKARPDPAIANC
ncbi:MAG TPA: four helix bundle protein [Terriglobales bacterium]